MFWQDWSKYIKNPKRQKFLRRGCCQNLFLSNSENNVDWELTAPVLSKIGQTNKHKHKKGISKTQQEQKNTIRTEIITGRIFVLAN